MSSILISASILIRKLGYLMRRNIVVFACFIFLLLGIATLYSYNEAQQPNLSAPESIGDGFELKRGITSDGTHCVYIKFPPEYYADEKTGPNGESDYTPKGKYKIGIQIAVVKLFGCSVFKDCSPTLEAYDNQGHYAIHYDGTVPDKLKGTMIGIEMLKLDQDIVGIALFIVKDEQQQSPSKIGEDIDYQLASNPIPHR